MRYQISVRRGALAIGAGLAVVAAMTCLAASPAQAGTVEVVMSPPPSAAVEAPATPAPSAGLATPAGLPKEPKQIQAIRQAASPSEAVQAYAEAIKINDKDPAAYDMYIRRMVGFGLTEILGAPAQALVKLDPNNGLGWAVLGFSLARQGNMPAAFDDAVKAVTASPKDPFVLQFAGQLAGWYSHQAGQEGLPQSILQAVLKLREFAGQSAYIQGYAAASNALQPPAPAPAETAAAAPAQNPGADGTYHSDTTQATQPPPSGDTGTYYYTESPTYYTSNFTTDYATPGYATYDQGYYMPYASPYYGYYGGIGFGSSFIGGTPFFFGHHRFGHDADDRMGRGTRTANNSLFFNSASTGTMARQRNLAGTAGATGVVGKTGVVTQGSRLSSAGTVGQPARTPAFSTVNGSTARWNSMSKGTAAPATVLRGSSAGTVVPHAMFSASASSFRAAPSHFSASPSFSGGAAHFSGGGVSHFSGGGAAHFSGGGVSHSSGGGAAHFSGGGGGGGGRSGGRR